MRYHLFPLSHPSVSVVGSVALGLAQMLRSLVVFFCCCGAVIANEARFEITPQLGYTFGGSLVDVSGTEFDVANDTSVGFTLNVRARADATFEFHYSRQETRVESDLLFANTTLFDLDIQKFEFGGTYRFNDSYPRPYVAVTLGITRLQPDRSDLQDDEYFSFTLGGGIRLYETQRFAVRADARWVGTVIGDDTDLACLSSGGVSCVITVDADLLSQFRVNLGLSARF